MSIAEKLTTIASNQQRVYDAGYSAGQLAGGYGEGYEAGKQAEYDRFWDMYQQNGNRISYQYAFGGAGWVDGIFNPKYSLAVLDSSNYMFASTGLTDISHLPRMKTMYGCGYMFFQAVALTHIGEIEIGTTKLALNGMFQGATKLHTIDKLIVKSGTTYSSTFTGCTSLANITFEGVIEQSINLQACPLTVASMKNIIACLAQYGGTAYDGAFTLRFSEDCWTALEADSTAPDGNAWRDYVENLGWLT
jgi:hypothetical protein